MPQTTPQTIEEIDAELEKVQQRITRTLQAIDQNFEICNQAVNGKIIPAVEEFRKASNEIWERSKTWLYFFQLQAYGSTTDTEQEQLSTNRPAHIPYTPTNTTIMDHTQPTATRPSIWERLNRDLYKQSGNSFEQSSTGLGSMKGIVRPSRLVDQRNINIARSIHEQIHDTGDFSSTHSSSLYAPTLRLLGIDDEIDSINNSSNNEHTDNSKGDRNMDINDMDQDDQQSTITKSSGMKRGTPIYAFTTTTHTATGNRHVMDKGKSVDTSNKKPRYEDNPMLEPHGSANRSTLMSRFEEAKQQPPSGKDIQHDSQHYTRSTPGSTSHKHNSSNVRTPIIDNLLDNIPTTERDSTPQHRNSSNNYESSQRTSGTVQDNNLEFSRPQPRHVDPITTAEATLIFNKQLDANDDIDMAYEFSPIIPHQAMDDNSGLTPRSRRDTSSSQASGYSMTGSTSSMMTMLSGVSGQIPAKFALHYFPETFRHPPASVRLTKMYNLFADRPGQLLMWRQVVDLMRVDPDIDDESELQQDSLRILLDILTRKRFLRRMDNGWTLRR